MARRRQSGPDSGFGFQATVLNEIKLFLFCSRAECRLRVRSTSGVESNPLNPWQTLVLRNKRAEKEEEALTKPVFEQ